MTGAVVVFTAAVQADQGVNVFLSPDLQNSIKGIMDANCQELNGPCFQSVRDGLINPSTELVARQLETAALVGAAVMAFVSLLFPFYYQESRPIPNPIKLDPVHISAASAAAIATETVVVPTSGPPVTMMPKPTPPTVTG